MAYRSNLAHDSESSSGVIDRYTDVPATLECPMYTESFGRSACTSRPSRYQETRRLAANECRRSWT